MNGGRSSKEDVLQGATFLNLIGSAAHEVSQTFTFDDEGDRKKLANLKEKLEVCYVPKRNTTMERHALLPRRQHADQLFGDEFITDLSMKTHFCDLHARANSLIRDCVILGRLREDIEDLAVNLTPMQVFARHRRPRAPDPRLCKKTRYREEQS